MISRRNFVKFGALATAGGYFIGLPGKLFGSIPGVIGPNSVSAEHLFPFVNSNFRFRHKEMRGFKNFRLLEVKRLNQKVTGLMRAKGDRCSLLFECKDNEQIEGRIYEISHDKAGKFSLFVSPVTQQRGLYEAVIYHV